MVPEGWTIKALHEITKEKISYGIVQAGPHVEGGVPYIKSSDVRRYINTRTLQKTSRDIHYKYRRSAVHPGDIVFSLRGNIGEVGVVPDDLPEANLTQGTARISVDSDNDPWFVFYQLCSSPISKRVNALSKGSTFKEISLEELRKVQIPIAPLEEQTKIASMLSAWDKAIETVEKLIENSREQKKALMQQLLSGRIRFPGCVEKWCRHLFSELALLQKNKHDPKSAKRILECVELEHIEQGTARLLGSTKTDPSMSTKSYFESGDVLFGKLRPYLKKYWLADRRGVCSTEIWVFRGNRELIIPEYLFQCVQADHFIESAGVSSGTHMPRADWRVVKDISLKIPGLSEQKKIAAILSAADYEICALLRKRDLLKREKESLMQQLLAGKKRVSYESLHCELLSALAGGEL